MQTVSFISTLSAPHLLLAETLKWPSGKWGRCGQSGRQSKQHFTVLFLNCILLKKKLNKQPQRKHQQSNPQDYIECFWAGLL